MEDSIQVQGGAFRIPVCPQWPTNAPAMFQFFMNDILLEHLDIICVGILDDVIVFSATSAEHVKHVRTILDILRKHKLYAKIKKCEFDREEMTFVGFLVSKSGIGMDPAKVAAVMEWPTPRNLKEVQSFLGFANFCRKFILHYSSLTSPLTSLTRKGVRFTWSSAADAALRQL